MKRPNKKDIKYQEHDRISFRYWDDLELYCDHLTSPQSNTEQARDDEIEDLVSIFWGDNYNKDDFEAIKERVLNWILSHPPKSEVVSDTTHPLVKEKEDKKQDDLSFIKCLYCKKFVDDCTC